MKINAEELKKVLDEIKTTKRIDNETVYGIIEDTLVGDFLKFIGGTEEDKHVIEKNIDLENGVFELFYVKKVVDEITDDFLETSLEEYKDDDPTGFLTEDKKFFKIPASDDFIKKSFLKTLKRKFSEKERDILIEQFKDYVHTLMEGTVESCDKKGCTLNILNASVFLPRSQMIGIEMYKPGNRVKVYVVNVGKYDGNKNVCNSSKINVTRTSSDFLKALMTEEIQDIFNGNVVIYDIARHASYQSKVAVYSKDSSIDPAGSCIGQRGAVIRKVRDQLGNGLSKERIDVITYSSNDALFIMAAIAPAKARGISIDTQKKTATIIVEDDQVETAIGKKGTNKILTEQLTGYSIENIISVTKAAEDNFPYQTLEEIQNLDIEEKSRLIKEKTKKDMQNGVPSSLPGLDSNYVPPSKRVYAEENNTELEEGLNQSIDNGESEVLTSETQNEATTVQTPSTDETKQVVTNVKTTTTLSDLEKSLEEDKSKGKSDSYKGGKKKKEKVTKTTEETKKNTEFMPIYTEEELAAIEAQEAEEEEDISDVDEYDDSYDDYYDDDKR